MHIIYEASSGGIVQADTVAGHPDGLPADQLVAVLEHHAEELDTATADMRVTSLNDATQHDLVARVRDSFCHIADGAVVVEGPRPRLTTDRDSIPADGATAAVVTFESGRAPASVTFDVNGSDTAEDVTNGHAQIEVVTTTPGPVVVTCEGLTVTIDATEVPA